MSRDTLPPLANSTDSYARHNSLVKERHETTDPKRRAELLRLIEANVDALKNT